MHHYTINMSIHQTSLILLVEVLIAIELVNSLELNDTLPGQTYLDLLVFLPYRSGPKKLPFGAEMSGAAGRHYS